MASTVVRRLVSLVAVVALGVIPGIVSAEGNVKVVIKRNAVVVIENTEQPSSSLFVDLRGKCDPGIGDVLEAFVSVEQQGEPGVSAFGFFGPACDGRRHRHIVRVQSFDGIYQPGKARASAFILICDADDNCVDGQASRVITIHSLEDIFDELN